MPNTPLKGDYNTYIGARYVPIIGGMWNQQTEYEPLTIVMYQGSSFTSKTFVPKGTQIDNTTYWVRTANYDEQVEFYRSEVQQFKKDIDASEAEYIATVQKAQSEYEASITKRQNEYEASITKQQNDYEDNLTVRQNEYEASITKQQNDYENNLTVRQNEYEASLQGNIDSEASARASADSNLQNSVDLIKTNLNAEVTARKEADTKLQNSVDLINIDKTEVVLFGDSWVDYNSDKEHVRIPERIEEGTGLTVHNYSHGGTGFEVSELGYIAQLDDFKNDASFDHNKVAYCILVAGLNEYNPQSSASYFVEELRKWVDKARTITNAPIYWFFDYSMINDLRNNIMSRTYAPQREYFDVISRNLKRNIVCTNMQGWVEWSAYANNWNTENWYHPNAAGSKQVGNNIVAVLQGKPAVLYPYAFIQGTWQNTNNINLSRTYLLFKIYGNQLIVNFTTPIDAIGTPDHYSYDVTFSHALPANLPDMSVIIATNLCINKNSTEGSASVYIPHHDQPIPSPESGYMITGDYECLKLGDMGKY